MLRVRPDAEPDVIRAAYRALARLYHPDVTASSEARDQMIAINRAWAILGDATARADHDQAKAAASATSGSTSPVRPAWMARHAPDRRPAGGWGAGAAGPPPGRPWGSTIDFGIYRGWSLGEVERRDPGYLDWLAERREGDPFRGEIRAIQTRRYQPPVRRPRFGFG